MSDAKIDRGGVESPPDSSLLTQCLEGRIGVQVRPPLPCILTGETGSEGDVRRILLSVVSTSSSKAMELANGLGTDMLGIGRERGGASRNALLRIAHRPGLLESEADGTATTSGELSGVTLALDSWTAVVSTSVDLTFFWEALVLVAEVENLVGLDRALVAFLDVAATKLPDATFFFRVEFHRFLIWFSVLPGSSTAILAHLVPISATSAQIFSSSSAEYGPRLMVGSR